MPLVILTGYPCSGLSYRARQLATLFEDLQSSVPEDSKARYKIHIVNAHDAAHPRTVYDAARSEKEARAVAYGRVKRLLGRDSIVILDGMNYIKGWRYQLWCDSKAAGTPCCVVHVGTPVDQCTKNNEARLKRKAQKTGGEGSPQSSEKPESSEPTTNDTNPDDEEPYPPDLHSNLIFRYEEPTTASRWDKPLFTVPWVDPTPPADEIWSAITGAPRKPAPSSTTTTPVLSNTPTSSETTTTTAPATSTTSTTFTRASRPKVIPHQATVQPTTTSPNTLHSLEKRTSEIISAIRSFTLANPTVPFSSLDEHGGLKIPIPDTQTPVFVPASALVSAPTEELAGAGGVLALPRLQRMRRQWVGLNRAVVGRAQGMINPEQVPDAFVRFLNAEFEGVGVDTDD